LKKKRRVHLGVVRRCDVARAAYPPWHPTMQTPDMFHRLQSPHASAGPVHGCPAAQRQLQVWPAEQSASTAQAAGREPSAPALAVGLCGVNDADTRRALGGGAHPATVSANAVQSARRSLEVPMEWLVSLSDRRSCVEGPRL
jgi:hypothetical protein